MSLRFGILMTVTLLTATTAAAQPRRVEVTLDQEERVAVRSEGEHTLRLCEGSCTLELPEGPFLIESVRRRGFRTVQVVEPGPQRLGVEVRSRRAWRIFGGVLALVCTGLGAAIMGADSASRDELSDGLGLAAGAGIIAGGLSLGIGLTFLRDRVTIVPGRASP